MLHLTDQQMQHYRNKERMYNEQREQLQKLKTENKRLKQHVRQQDETITALRREIEDLKASVADLTTKLYGEKKKDRKKKKKQPRDATDTDDTDGGSAGSSSPMHRPRPRDEEVTETQHHPVSHCKRCRGTLTHKVTLTFYVEDIPLPVETPWKSITKHIIERGWCPHCRRRVYGASPPSAAVTLGPNLRSFVAYATVILRLSYTQTAFFLETFSSLSVSDGEIAKILTKEANRLRQPYQHLLERIRAAHAAHYDETVYPLHSAGVHTYAWVMTHAESADTAFLIGRSRGKGNAEELKGDARHTAVTDDYGAYRTLFSSRQLCFAHPHRKLRDIASLSTFSGHVQEHCTQVYRRFSRLYRALRRYCSTREAPAPASTYHAYRRELAAIAAPDERDPKKLAAIKQRLAAYPEQYLTCLTDPRVPCDNNRAERALRHLVIKRKTSFGVRTSKGAETLSILSSVLLSEWWRDKRAFFSTYLAMRKG